MAQLQWFSIYLTNFSLSLLQKYASPTTTKSLRRWVQDIKLELLIIWVISSAHSSSISNYFILVNYSQSIKRHMQYYWPPPERQTKLYYSLHSSYYPCIPSLWAKPSMLHSLSLLLGAITLHLLHSFFSSFNINSYLQY